MIIKIDVSPGELIDKITILEIKLEHIRDSAKLANVRYEHALLVDTMNQHIVSDSELATLRVQLKAYNEEVWRVEEELRELERHKDFGPAFIEAADRLFRQR